MLKEALTKKYAGVPGFILAGVAGLGIFLIVKMHGASSAAAASGPSSPSSVAQDYTPGTPPSAGRDYPLGRDNQGPFPAPNPLPPGGSWGPGRPGSAPGVTPPWPSSNGTAPPARGPVWYGPAASFPEHVKEYRKLHPGQPDPVYGGLHAGVGGPVSVGSRSASLMHGAHPLLKRRVVYTHFVRAVGGPGAHEGEIHRVAKAAGIHPARLQALNPTYTGRIRIA